jgi:hypothetical protein
MVKLEPRGYAGALVNQELLESCSIDRNRRQLNVFASSNLSAFRLHFDKENLFHYAEAFWRFETEPARATHPSERPFLVGPW